jgi:hypothetical protein
MKRAGWVLVMMSIAGCLEPGDLSNPDAIYDAIAAQDSGVSDGGSGGSGGMGGGGGMGGSGGMGGGMGGSGGGMSGTGGGDASTGECGDVLEDVLRPSCAMTFCHSTTAMGSLDLEADEVAMRLIDQPGSGDCEEHSFINAENPEDSLIYTKLNDPPPCGSQMPFSGDKFTAAQKACVLEYIEQVIADQ